MTPEDKRTIRELNLPCEDHARIINELTASSVGTDSRLKQCEDTLIRLSAVLEGLMGSRGLIATVADHESRLAAQEKAQNRLLGALLLIQFIGYGGLITTLIFLANM